MKSTMTDRDIESIWDENRSKLWRQQQRILVDAAIEKQYHELRHELDIYGKELELTIIRSLNQLWIDVLQRDEIVDKMAGNLTDLLRMHTGSDSEIQQIMNKYATI